MKTKTKIKRRRKFTYEFKKARVREFEKGKLTALEITREYQLGLPMIYKWIRKYSIYHQNNYQVVVEEKSLSTKNKALRKRVEELEAMLGRKQMEVEYLQKVIDISSDDLEVDLKKKHGTAPSNGFGETKPHTSGK
ncbi:MAG: transposase [Flavobacteriales bacterium]|nr:transposase [Flavobacteriales bacterium]